MMFRPFKVTALMMVWHNSVPWLLHVLNTIDGYTVGFVLVNFMVLCAIIETTQSERSPCVLLY